MFCRKPTRSRDAAATRAAILESARHAFVTSGYDGAGVRDIAKGAGVTAMLINRYFGSKEALFEEVLARANQSPIIATAENAARTRQGCQNQQGAVAGHATRRHGTGRLSDHVVIGIQ